MKIFVVYVECVEVVVAAFSNERAAMDMVEDLKKNDVLGQYVEMELYDSFIAEKHGWDKGLRFCLDYVGTRTSWGWG